MLKQHSQFMVSMLVVGDALAVALAWLLSYWVRFNFLPVDPSKGVPDLGDRFLPMLPVVVIAHLIVFYRVRLYRPRRADRPWRETRDIVKAFVVAVVVVVLLDYALPATNKISRQFVATYAVLGTVLFAAFRVVVRLVLHSVRRRGWNLRWAAIVGSGRSAQRLAHAIEKNDWMGMRVAYFVDDRGNGGERRLRGVPLLGPLSSLRQIVEERAVDSVFIALPTEQTHRTVDVLEALETSMADVRLVPEIIPAYAMRPNVSQVDGIAVLSLRQTPLYGWNAILKRAFDLVVGLLCLLVAAPAMLVIAVFVKLGSPGPVFYKQRRMGLDGQEFEIYKFRTMRADAEAQTGPVWAQKDDPRRTSIGRFLRRTSLDELPNLFNVLLGQMSLVGPRPERPELIRRFKDEIPHYMLRHKMKAGMTGFAQIRGLRGDTPLKKRIQHDVYYIRNWSLGTDLRILLQTVTGVWFSRHET